MSPVRDELVEKLEKLPDITVALYKGSDLLCVYFKGKEIAHFQNDREIDIRLTPALIKREKLFPHPARRDQLQPGWHSDCLRIDIESQSTE